MGSFLKQMAKTSAARAGAARAAYTSAELDRPVHALRLAGFDVIAEIKNRSPAEGQLDRDAATPALRAKTYVDGGAAAISVLTEPDRFDGSLDHLRQVVDAVAGSGIPVMRKDFLVDPAQIVEARAAGASGVLLIAAMLDDATLGNMLDCAFDHELFVLLESFDQVDLERSKKMLRQRKYRARADRQEFLVGVNTRDLRTLAVDPTRLARFGPLLPAGVVCVAESGQHSAEDALQAADLGYRMALVGTALMRADDPAALISDMLAAGRAP